MSFRDTLKANGRKRVDEGGTAKLWERSASKAARHVFRNAPRGNSGKRPSSMTSA